jgi:predicted RNA-binding protein with PIN domain
VTDDAAQLIVVDAANVVGSRPDGWWRDRPGAARRLLTNLKRFAATLDSSTGITVILEGAARGAVEGADDPEYAGLIIVLARGEGDDTIVDVVAQAVAADSNRQITVVTADRGLRDRVEAHGATTTGPRWLLDQLDT